MTERKKRRKKAPPFSVPVIIFLNISSRHKKKKAIYGKRDFSLLIFVSLNIDFFSRACCETFFGSRKTFEQVNFVRITFVCAIINR